MIFLLQDHGCTVGTLATDRHPGVNKMLREKYPDVTHEYDLWHIVKGIKKKLLASKVPELVPWVRSISNQLWYCAATCEGNASILKEKWLGVLHHTRNQHEWLGGDHITCCEHPPYTQEEAEKRPWLHPTSKAFQVLQKVVMDRRLLQDLEKVELNRTFASIN